MPSVLRCLPEDRLSGWLLMLGELLGQGSAALGCLKSRAANACSAWSAAATDRAQGLGPWGIHSQCGNAAAASGLGGINVPRRSGRER